MNYVLNLTIEADKSDTRRKRETNVEFVDQNAAEYTGLLSQKEAEYYDKLYLTKTEKEMYIQ